ncbi:MAG TPA: hypothetical protein VL426_00460 [Candidatus Binatia bacterium]|jgi:hypothetical protein|nr:hypothetical protein [Candidatus Binatia bacterium]
MNLKRSILAVAPLAALLFLGVGCNELWDKYVLGEDSEQRRIDSDRQYSAFLDREAAEKAAKEREAQQKLDAARRAPTQTYLNLAKKLPAEIRAMAPIVVPMLTYDGQKFPFPEDQFTKSQPDHCAQVHYHGGVGFSMEFKKVRQPDDPCGFGSDVKDEEVDTEAIIRWMQEGPKALHL